MKSLSYFFLISFVILLTACNQANEQKSSPENNQVLLSIDDFYERADEYIGEEVTISGLVTHVCKHGGQKLFITSSETNEALRIDVGEEISEFDIKLEGSEAEFTGMIHLMDEDFFARAEAEEKEHHGEEEDCEEEELSKAGKEKQFYLVAQKFRNL
ncbi:MAG: hypothetical protein ACOCZL_01405 [Bacteroidota bacterium]